MQLQVDRFSLCGWFYSALFGDDNDEPVNFLIMMSWYNGDDDEEDKDDECDDAADELIQISRPLYRPLLP